MAEIASSAGNSDRLNRATMLDQESVTWWDKYKETNDRDDLEQAVRISWKSVEALGSDDNGGGIILSHLNQFLIKRLEATPVSCFKDFEEAVSVGQRAVLAIDPSMSLTPWWRAHNTLSASMFLKILRFPTRTSLADLDETIGIQKQALEIQELDDHQAFTSLSRLSAMFGTRYRRTSSVKDIETAIKLGYQSLEKMKELESPGEECDSGYANLSTALFDYFRATQLFGSLEEALDISRQGLDICTAEPPESRARSLCNHGSMLETKCLRYGNSNPGLALVALEEAIKWGQEAMDILPEHDDFGPHLYNHVAAWVGTKMKITGDLAWGEKGAKLLESALQLIKSGQAAHIEPSVLQNLAHLLEVQHQILNARGNRDAALRKLSEAIPYGEKSVVTSQSDDEFLGERHKNLAAMLFSKYLETGRKDEDLVVQSKQHFILAAKNENSSLLIRIPSAIQAGLFCWSDRQPAEAHRLLQDAVSLLPTQNPHSISKQDLQQTLSQVSGLAVFAASIALEAGGRKAPFEALQCLEASRCVISGLSMSSKTDITDLRKKYPIPAKAYDELRDKLAQAARQMKSPVTYQAARQLQQSLIQDVAVEEEKIRALKGFEHFQLPLTEEKIKDLAEEGPIIVINASKIRCDAIIVTSKEIDVLKLNDMEYGELESNIGLFNEIGNENRRNAVPSQKRLQKKNASKVLRWLWNVAVRPILDNLDKKIPSLKRIWWITSGLAGRLPLHAAGHHTRGSTETTLSRVVSSYISSFKALRYARDRSSSLFTASTRNMLLVTMSENPPPHRHLSTVYEEDATKNVFGESLTHLPHPDPKSVLAKLPDYSFVHFACHGSSVAYDPSQSGLLLVKDGEAAMLTISDLEDVDFKTGAIAYLSACSTAEQPDGKLADEAIHLANSFQSLGFQHVIGTLWGADDVAAGEMARRFYERLAGARSGGENRLEVAEALHQAIIDYKDSEESAKDFLIWGPFIHIGV